MARSVRDPGAFTSVWSRARTGTDDVVTFSFCLRSSPAVRMRRQSCRYFREDFPTLTHQDLVSPFLSPQAAEEATDEPPMPFDDSAEGMRRMRDPFAITTPVEPVAGQGGSAVRTDRTEQHVLEQFDGGERVTSAHAQGRGAGRLESA